MCLAFRHCEERQREVIHASACRGMDCFAEPVSGAHSRDPLDRNDGENCSPDAAKQNPGPPRPRCDFRIALRSIQATRQSRGGQSR